LNDIFSSLGFCAFVDQARFPYSELGVARRGGRPRSGPGGTGKDRKGALGASMRDGGIETRPKVNRGRQHAGLCPVPIRPILWYGSVPGSWWA